MAIASKGLHPILKRLSTQVSLDSRKITGKWAIFLLAVSLVLLTGACGPSSANFDLRSGSNGTVYRATAFASVTITDTEPNKLAKIVAIPSSIIIRPGETTLFTAIAFDQSGVPIDNLIFNWRVKQESAGFITPTGIFQAGQTEGIYPEAIVVESAPLIGQIGGLVEGTVDVIVTRDDLEGVPTSIRFFPEISRAEAGQTIFLSALAMDNEGTLLPGIRPSWEITDVRAGTISSNGAFTAGEIPGSYPGAILVSLPSRPGSDRVRTTIDVLVLEPNPNAPKVRLFILPQLASLIPGQSIVFSVVALNPADGQRIEDIIVTWRMADPSAGMISESGLYKASEEPGIYGRAVEAEISLPARFGTSEVPQTANANIAIITPSDDLLDLQKDPLGRLAIFPADIAISPGESSSLSVFGFNELGPNIRVVWSLNPELGSISSFGIIKAANKPGIYPDAVQALVSVETNEGLVNTQIFTDLVIRGPLESTTITPFSVTVNPGRRLKFRAVSTDVSGTVLHDVTHKFSMSDDRAGEIDKDGFFKAGDQMGDYDNAVTVIAEQRINTP